MGLLGQIYEDFYDTLKYWWITFWKFSPRATAPMLRYMSHISFLIEKVGKFFCFSFILCYIFQCFRRKKVCIFVCVDYQFSQFSSVAQLCPTLCNPMHCSMPGFPVSSPSPRACSNSCPLSRGCHPTISSSVISFPSFPQSFPASGSFLMSQLFASGGQSIGASASASVLLVNIQSISFRMDWLISLQSKG